MEFRTFVVSNLSRVRHTSLRRFNHFSITNFSFLYLLLIALMKYRFIRIPFTRLKVCSLLPCSALFALTVNRLSVIRENVVEYLCTSTFELINNIHGKQCFQINKHFSAANIRSVFLVKSRINKRVNFINFSVNNTIV